MAELPPGIVTRLALIVEMGDEISRIVKESRQYRFLPTGHTDAKEWRSLKRQQGKLEHDIEFKREQLVTDLIEWYRLTHK